MESKAADTVVDEKLLTISPKLKKSLDTFHSDLSKVCPEHKIAYLINLHTSLLIASDAADDAAAISYAALQIASNSAVMIGLDNSTSSEQRFESTLAAQKHASEKASEEANAQMAIERSQFIMAAIEASDASTLLLVDLQLKYDAAATAAADASYSSLLAQRLASEMVIKRDESKRAAQLAQEASALLLVNLQLKYEAAATAAADLSDSSLTAQRLASQRATEVAELEAKSRMTTEKNASKLAAVLASEASDTKFLNQKWKFEAMAVAAADASDSSLIAERFASQLATEAAELEATSRMTLERNESKQAALIASEESASKFLDLRLMYEAAATAAANASDSSLTAQRFASQLAKEKAVIEADSEMAIERRISKQAALIASEASALLLANLQLKYEAAATAAADLSDSSLVAQRFASQLATEAAMVVADLRITTERNASKEAAMIASMASDTKFLDQKSKYETAAVAAANASESKMAIEQAQFTMATKSADEAFALQLTDNTKNTERLELQAKCALMEIEQLRSISVNVAHDLKSPLHTLLIGLESMRTGNDLNSHMRQPQNEEMLDTLNSACAFMTSAISRTIEFSKTSSGMSLTPSNTSFNLQAALDNPMKWMNAMLPPDGKKSILLDPIPEEISILITDKHWAEENLLCLLSNAVKYSNKGVIRAVVALKGGMVSVTVEDNGIGISAESKLLLFKQFSKLQNSTVGSTGLGLYSLSKRAEAIGGSCGVNDRSDGLQGSSFWFTFPYRPDTCEENEKNSSQHTKCAGIKSANRSLDILIVDDSTSVVKILTNKLAGAGHRVVNACNGAEGLETMTKMAGKLDVVFMDIQMPVMDGIEATKRYRKIERNQGKGKHLPIICSSANSGGEAEELALAAGVDSFLPKPFTTSVLLGVIDSVIRGLL